MNHGIACTLREEIFAGINFRELGFTEYFAGINFHEFSLTKDFPGINFQRFCRSRFNVCLKKYFFNGLSLWFWEQSR